MCEDDGSVNIDVASEFVCKMYGQPKETDVDKARLSKLMQMTGKINKVGFCPLSMIRENLRLSSMNMSTDMPTSHYYGLLFLFQDNPLVNIKRVDCALLPPSRPTLEKQLQRAHFVTMMWSHADQASPDQGRSPTDYGWSTIGDILQPTWFDGPAVPVTLFTPSDSRGVENDTSDGTIIEDDSLQENLDDAGFESETSDSDLSDNELWSEDSDSGSDPEDDY